MVTKSAKRVASFLGTSALTRPLFALGAASALLGAGQAQALDANTLPQNPNVVGGKDSFAQSGNTLNVNQSTKRTVIDWRSFDIGSKAQVNFNQPGTSAIAVNRVNSSANATQIEGGLHANGQVWILNPNGVFFGKGAHVDAAGIVASTANIDTNAFMAGSNKLQMTGADHGSVENQGNISVGANGLAAFVAPSVRNSGVINATVGKVALAAGTTYTLDLAGDHLVELGLGSVKAVVDNSGRIVNPGGTIALTAKAAGQVVSSVVNVSGVVSASSVSKSGGTITLGGDNINTTATAQLSADAGTNGNGGAITSVANVQGNYAGSFSAKGGSQSGNGGKVETSGKSVHVDAAAKIDASAPNGIAGTWLLDPLNVTIESGSDDGNTSGATVYTQTIENLLGAGTSVDITTSQGGTDDGDLTLANSINATSSGNAGLTLEGRHLFATGGSTINITGGALTLDVNTVSNTASPGASWISDAVGMIGSVSGGTTINLGAGNYDMGAAQLDISKSLSLVGAGVGVTNITSSSASYGIYVTGDDVSLQNFTYHGPTYQGVPGNRASTYGIKVEPGTNVASDRVTGFDIENVTIDRGYRTGLDLNGVDGATIKNVSVSNIVYGAGIALTDSADVTITGSSTADNSFGGLALFQTNTYYDQKLNNIIVDGTNTFSESNPIYVEDQSTTQDPGTLNLAGYGYIAQFSAGVNDFYTLFRTSAQGAIDSAVSASPTTAYVQGYAGNGEVGNNVFYVGYNTANTQALSIATAVGAASSGGTINVGAGTYTDSVDINKSVTLLGANAGVNAANGSGTAPTTRGAETILSHNGLSALTIDANNVTVDGFEFTGGNGRLIDWASASNIDGLTIKNNIFNLPSGPQNGGVIQLAGTGTAKNIDIANNLFEGNAFAASGDISSTWVYVGGTATNGFSGLTLSGNDFTGGADNAVFQGAPTFDSLSVTYNYFSGSHGLIEGLNMGSLDNPTISGNQFVGVVYTGMQIGTTNGGLIENNTFDGTGSGYVSGGVRYASGMEVWGGQYGTASSNGLTITGNTFKNFVDASPLSASDRVAAIYLRPADSGPGGAGPLSITNNTIENNTVGLLANTSVTGSTVTGNTFTDNATQVRDLQGAFNLATLAASNTLDADVWITGGNSLFGNIQAGVDASVNGDTVNVGTGTYNESVTIDDNISLVGADTDHRSGITGGILMTGSLSNITLKNLDVSGTVSGNAADFVIKDSGGVNNFTMDHVLVDGESVAGRFGVGGGQYSGAISITNSEFKNFTGGNAPTALGGPTGWVLFDTRSGAGSTVGVNDGTVLTSVVFTGNVIDNAQGGIAFRQLGNGGPYADVTISNNLVENVGDAVNSFGGIFKVFNAGTVTFSGNDISGIGTSGFNPAGEAAYGAALLTRGVTTLNVTDNTFTDNNMAFAVEPGKALAGTVNFTGNTFDNNKYSIYLPANVSGSGTINFGAGNNFINSANTVKDIVWTSTSDLDLTNVAFNGKLGSAMTDNELYGVEDLITDGLDNSAYGLARLKAGNIYVTAASGSIQNGVTKASAGDTINVGAGTYDAFGTSFGGPADLTIQTSDGAVIDGSTRPGTNRIVDLRADGTTFTGFTIDGDGGGVGISISGQGVTASGNTINNTLTGIQTTTQNAAGNATITGNIIDASYGLSLQNTGNTVSGNTVTASTEGVGLLQSANTFSSNTFNIGPAGNALDYYGAATATGLTASGNTVNIQGGGVQGAVDLAGTNGALNLAAGSYTLASTLNVANDGLTISGAGEGTTTIDGSGVNFGNMMRVSADNVSLRGFTLEAGANGSNGISVLKPTGFDGNSHPLSGQGVKNFSIANVTINEHAAGFTGLSLTGVEVAAVNHVTVDNGGSGNAIQISDSANVVLKDTHTSNSDFGFVVIQNGDATSEQTTGVSADASNGFVATLAPVNIIDVSTAGPGIGTLDIEGFALAIGTPQHLELHNGLQSTIDRAAALDATNSFIEGWTGTGVDNNFTVGTGTGTLGTMSIAAANAAASDGAIINVLAGNYTLAGELDITKSLSLIGTGPATVITSNSTGYGINVTADDVSLKLFTFNAPTTHNGTTYGIKVTPDTNVASDRLLNFNIDGVTINGGWRTGLDLNGVLGATIQNVSVSNVQNGNGIALTDSANVTIVNDTTSNNAWGGLALYQTNTYYDQQLNNIVVSSLNNFGEANGVYEEDQSASLDMGSLTLAGYNAAAIDKSVSNDQYTFFQRNADAALAFATNGALNGGHLNAAHTYVEGWNGTALNNIFNVGPGLTIQAAENAAAAGGTINVSTGTYAEDVTVGTQLSFDLGDVGVNSFTLGSSAAGSSLNGNLTATSAIASSGTVNLNGKFTAASIAMSGAATLTGSSMLDTSAANGNIAIASVVAGGGHALALKTGTGTTSLGDVANAGSITALGAVTLTGTNYGAGAETLGATTLTGDTTFNTGDGNVVLASLIGGGHAATVVAGNTSLGNVANAGGVAVNGAATLTGSSYSGSSFAFGGPVALTNDTTLGATGAITLASLDGGGNDLAVTSGTASLGNVANAGALSVTGPATLTGTSYVAGSIGLGATTLTGNTTLDTSAANGAISVASVDGTTAGGQSLGINAGSGSVSLGNLGAATRMGAVSDASKTTLTGSTYNANSFLFGGDVTLTSANTTLNTTQSASAAGGITFQGDLFGTTDGGQSLTLTAGPGTGAASANGDILLQNAGTTAINLNNLTVSGDDFTAMTVDLAGNYNSQLTGNQVFAADTLNVRGNASSIVGGDASGHIVAGGDVTIAAGGDISGTISGQNVNLTGDDVNSVVTATNAANIKGNTVEGSYTANTVTLIASNNVDAAVDATDFTLAANHGSVDGNWVTINTDGSNVVSVNGQTTVGLANVNPNQLVVEGFVLPAGTRIGANGQLILPQGVLLGLLSPGGGKPKMILVHSVQQLGELLAGGYSVIVIDLSNRDSGKPIQLASN